MSNQAPSIPRIYTHLLVIRSVKPVTQPSWLSERHQTRLTNLSGCDHAFLAFNRANVQSFVGGSLQDFMAVETIKALCRVLAGCMRTTFHECVIPCRGPRQIRCRITIGTGRTYVFFEENGDTSGVNVLEPRYIIDVAINDDPLWNKHTHVAVSVFFTRGAVGGMHDLPGRLACCATCPGNRTRAFRVSQIRSHIRDARRAHLGHLFSGKRWKRLRSHFQIVEPTPVMNVN